MAQRQLPGGGYLNESGSTVQRQLPGGGFVNEVSGASDQNLTPSLFTNTNTFYSPTVSLASGDQSLTPGLFTNTNTFYSPTVSWDQNLTVSLFTNSNTFFAATVSLAGDQSLNPSLFTNTNTFYAPTVTRVPGFLTPVLKNNTGTVLSNETGIACNIYHSSTRALVVRKTGLTSDASGIVSVTDAAMTAGSTYSYEIELSSGARRLPTAVA